MAEETIWQELDRFIGSIEDEIRSGDQENSSIDFWLFKIKRRVDILHSALDKNFKLYQKNGCNKRTIQRSTKDFK